MQEICFEGFQQEPNLTRNVSTVTHSSSRYVVLLLYVLQLLILFFDSLPNQSNSYHYLQLPLEITMKNKSLKKLKRKI